jgi:hypothetical protein
MRRPRQLIFCSDGTQIPMHGSIAGQDKMIAIVDDHIEQAVVVGAATASCLLRRFIYDDLHAATCRSYGCGQSGKTGTHDVNSACLSHSIIQPRNTAQPAKAGVACEFECGAVVVAILLPAYP